MITVTQPAAKVERRKATCNGCKTVLHFDASDAHPMPSRPGENANDLFIQCPTCSQYVFAGR